MNITLSVDEQVVFKARQRAEGLGTTVNQLVRDYLAELGGQIDHATAAEEFERLSRAAGGNSDGWKFDREEIYRR